MEKETLTTNQESIFIVRIILYGGRISLPSKADKSFSNFVALKDGVDERRGRLSKFYRSPETYIRFVLAKYLHDLIQFYLTSRTRMDDGRH